ncbi:AXIN1 isoform 4, partial [Pan troglodytes]
LEEEEKRASRAPSKQRTRSQRKVGGGSAQPCDSIVVAYYFCGEPIPYRTLVRGRAVTLGQFKELLTKKGSYRPPSHLRCCLLTALLTSVLQILLQEGERRV